MISNTILQPEIPRRLNQCHKCGVAFSGGDGYSSQLTAAAARQDFCIPCFTTVAAAPATSQWKGTVPIKQTVAAAAVPLNKQQRLLELLKATIDEQPAEALLLALYLVRKKALLLRRDRVEAGCSYSMFEVAATAEIIAIRKTSLSQLDDTLLKESLAAKLATVYQEQEAAAPMER
jgi:hypothetical protein